MSIPAEVAVWLAVAALAAASSAASAAPSSDPGADRAATAWVRAHLTGRTPVAPFSFVYGGRPSGDFLARWQRAARTRKLDAVRTEHTVTYTDPATGLRASVTARVYRDAPAVEWLLRLANTGKTDTPLIESIQALDARFAGRSAQSLALHYALGDSNSADSFRPLKASLAPGEQRAFAPAGGLSSNGFMPYFNVQGFDGGVAVAIGWPGQWAATFRNEGGSPRVLAGQELTHLVLRPGEEIRTPRILLAFWSGSDHLAGNHALRGALVKHYAPRRGGEVVYAPICGSVGEVEPDGSYEGPHIRVMKPLAAAGVEVFWSDMDPQQWYPGGFPEGTGTWEPDPVKYPRGLKPVGDAAREAGLGYLLWFEPERVARGTQIARDHPEWVEGGAEGGLFRLDLPEARRWITDKVDVQIALADLSWVRWDFNMPPLGHWRRVDAPDRQGITEIRHVEGLYAMWAELQRRHPGLLIDICAGGGRRLDFETGMYGIPLWHSDLQCFGAHPEADQLQNAALYRWLPQHACGVFGLEPSYPFRSAMTTGNIFALAAHAPENADAVRRSVAIQKRLRPYVLGDFYDTLPHRADPGEWFAYQFHRPDLDGGFLVAYRRANCADPAHEVGIRGVDARARYDVDFVDTGVTRRMAGAELAGLKVVVPEAPGSALVVYSRARQGR